MNRSALIVVLLSLCLGARAQDKEGAISQFRDNYIIGGGPVGQSWDNSTADLKFQTSFRLKPVSLPSGWTLFAGYTQISVWNFLDESAPFRDNAFLPGLYLRKSSEDGAHAFEAGFEHCSNGRPYFGTRTLNGSRDDYSRGMNYLYASWRISAGCHNSFCLKARFGEGCRVDGVDPVGSVLKQDLYVYFLGYVNLNWRYYRGRFSADASVTPISNRSLANVTADVSCRLFRDYPLCVYAQFHRGYDEAMCDIVAGAAPPTSIRFGFVVRQIWKN